MCQDKTAKTGNTKIELAITFVISIAIELVDHSRHQQLEALGSPVVVEIQPYKSILIVIYSIHLYLFEAWS